MTAVVVTLVVVLVAGIFQLSSKWLRPCPAELVNDPSPKPGKRWYLRRLRSSRLWCAQHEGRGAVQEVGYCLKESGNDTEAKREIIVHTGGDDERLWNMPRDSGIRTSLDRPWLGAVADVSAHGDGLGASGAVPRASAVIAHEAAQDIKTHIIRNFTNLEANTRCSVNWMVIKIVGVYRWSDCRIDRAQIPARRWQRSRSECRLATRPWPSAEGIGTRFAMGCTSGQAQRRSNNGGG